MVKIQNFDVYLQFFSCFLDSLTLSIVIFEVFSAKFTQSWVKNIYQEKELDESATSEDFSVVQREGNREVARKITWFK